MLLTPSVWVQTILKMLVVCFLYVFLGRIALWLAVPPGYAMAVYPPAGLALAAALIFGKRMALAVGIGSMLLNFWITWERQQAFDKSTLLLVSLISCGAMLQALIGCWLIKKTIGYPTALDNNRSILQFMLFGCLLACTVNASIGVGTLYSLGIVESSAVFNNWFTWWLGDCLGVLVVTPAGMILFGEPASIWRARRINVLLPLLVTLALVVLVFVIVRNWEQERMDNEFRDRAERLSSAVQARLDYHIDVQKSVVALFTSVEQISDTQFSKFVAQPISNYSALRGIAWVPLVSKEGRGDFERQTKPVPLFEITELGNDGKFLRAAQRTEYFPVNYVSPAIGNNQLLGLDLATLPALSDAINEARDIGLVVASAPLANIAPDKNVAALVSPIFASQQSRLSIEVRRKSMNGLVVSFLDLGDVVESVLGAHDKDQVLMRLSDVPSASSKYVYLNILDKSLQHVQGKQKILSFNLDFAGRELQLQLKPSSGYLKRQVSWAAWGALVGGMLFVGIVGMYLLVVSGRSFSIEALVEQRTRQLHDSEHRLSAILDNAANGILTVDGDGQMILFNRALYRLLGFSPEQLAEQFFDKVFTVNGRGLAISEALPQMDEQGRIVKNVEGRCADGSHVPMELAIAKVGLKNQSLYIVVVHDLTERRRVDQLKGDFVSAVSHELRTPLTSIRGSLGLLVGGVCGKMPEKMERLVKLASDNAEHLSVLINDLLDFEKLELGGMPFHFAPHSLRQVVLQAVDNNQGYAQKFNVKMNLQFANAGSYVVNVDEGRVIQILSNLLSNAIKFSHTNGVVEVLVSCDEQFATVLVIDHGVGIAEEFKPRIFEKFSQADGSVTKKHYGTGLGLSIAKMMAEKMNGEVGFSSKLGEGSTFYLRMPLHREKPQALA